MAARTFRAPFQLSAASLPQMVETASQCLDSQGFPIFEPLTSRLSRRVSLVGFACLNPLHLWWKPLVEGGFQDFKQRDGFLGARCSRLIEVRTSLYTGSSLQAQGHVPRLTSLPPTIFLLRTSMGVLWPDRETLLAMECPWRRSCIRATRP